MAYDLTIPRKVKLFVWLAFHDILYLHVLTWPIISARCKRRGEEKETI